MITTARATSMATIAALVIGATLAGCSSPSSKGDQGEAGRKSPPELTVADPYIPVPAGGDLAVGYFTVRNAGGTDDRLVKVTTKASEKTTLYRYSGTTMKSVSGFDIPAHGALRLNRAGNHVMLSGLSSKPKLGQEISLELHFAKSSPLAVAVPVRSLTYRPPGEG